MQRRRWLFFYLVVAILVGLMIWLLPTVFLVNSLFDDTRSAKGITRARIASPSGRLTALVQYFDFGVAPAPQYRVFIVDQASDEQLEVWRCHYRRQAQVIWVSDDELQVSLESFEEPGLGPGVEREFKLHGRPIKVVQTWRHQ